MYRQQEVFTRKLMDELALIKFNIDNCMQEYVAKLNRIHESVQFRTAIPTDRVFVSNTPSGEMKIFLPSVNRSFILAAQIHRTDQSMVTIPKLHLLDCRNQPDQQLPG
jgi:hypothetical protein